MRLGSLMDLSIAAVLLQDGITTGAIYALLGMSLVLVFSVTRVLSFAHGEFVSYSALSLAALQAGRVPGIVWLVAGTAVVAGTMEVVDRWRDRDVGRLPKGLLQQVVLPVALAGLTAWAAFRQMSLLVQCLLCLAMVTSMGVLAYRIVYQPIAKAPVLALLIASVGLQLVFVGLGLLFFGVDGVRTPSFWEARLELGGFSIAGQAIVIVLTALALIAGLWIWFSWTMRGAALRATASNPLGAQLMAISVPFSGALSFGLSAFIGGLCGLLIGPVVTIYYDSGLMIGLKGLVAAVVGAFASYPLTLVGALGVGILEVVASFWASAYKEVVVFLSVIPVLLVLSWRHGPREEGN